MACSFLQAVIFKILYPTANEIALRTKINTHPADVPTFLDFLDSPYCYLIQLSLTVYRCPN